MSTGKRPPTPGDDRDRDPRVVLSVGVSYLLGWVWGGLMVAHVIVIAAATRS